MEPLSTTAKRELSHIGAFLESVTSLNPRPFEIVSVAISLGVSLVLFASPGLFDAAIDYPVVWPEWGWAWIFLALALSHLVTLALPSGRRGPRRVVIMVKLVYSSFVFFLVIATPPFAFADVLFLVYALVNACVFLQLRFGRPL